MPGCQNINVMNYSSTIYLFNLTVFIFSLWAPGLFAETTARHISKPIKPVGQAKWTEDGNAYTIEIMDKEHGRLTLTMRISNVTESSYTLAADGTDYEKSASLPAEAGATWLISQKKRLFGKPFTEAKSEAFIRFLIQVGYFKFAFNEIAQLSISPSKKQTLQLLCEETQIRHRIDMAQKLINLGDFTEAGRLTTDVLQALAAPLEKAALGDDKNYQRLSKLAEKAQELQVVASKEFSVKKKWTDFVFKITQALKGASGSESILIKRLLPDLDGPLPASQRQRLLKELHLENRTHINYSDALDALMAFSFHIRYGSILKTADVPGLEDFFIAETAINSYLNSSPEKARDTLAAALKTIQRGFLDKALNAIIRFGNRVGPPPTPPANEPDNGFLKVHASGDELEVGLDYLVTLPPNYHSTRRSPLLIVCHGTHEKALKELIRFHSEATGQGWIVVAPELVIGRDKGYLGTIEEREMIMRTLKDCSQRFAVDPNRIYLAGHSMGAFLTWDVALTYPDRFAGAAPFDGCVTGTAQNHLRNTFFVPFYCVGSAKNKNVAKANHQTRTELMRLGWPQQMNYVEFHKRGKGGYLSEISPALKWLATKSRRRLPKQIKFASADEETSRVHWLKMLPNKIKKPLINQRSPNTGMGGALRKRGTANITARIKGENFIQITASKVYAIRIFISPALFNMKRSLRVSINGKPTKAIELVASRKQVLELTRQTGDRDQPYWCSVDLPVPK